MKRLLQVVSFWILLVSLGIAAAGAEPKNKRLETMPVDQIHAGMRGVAYTVFEGVKPEPMEVEILGVMKNVNGPKGDIILVRLHGAKVERTGVVAGMSGSPVYVDGKLIGALAFRIGQFSLEPIGGVTPIAEMLEINEIDGTQPTDGSVARPQPPTMTKTSGPGDFSGIPGVASALTPIETPLAFSGFGEETMRLFGAQFQAVGIMPVMGAGSTSNEPQPEPLEPGSAVSAILVQGDMNIAATCTVTMMDAEHLLACGHPLMQFGSVELPMTKARVLMSLASPLNAFKIVNTTETVGAFVQDRHTGIMGRFERKAEMIPVTLNVRGGVRPKTFHYEVLNNAKLTPVAMMATVFQALQGLNEYGEEVTYRMNGRIGVSGYPDVSMANMFAPLDNKQPTAFSVALSVGDRFGRIFDNAVARPTIEGVELDVELVKERRWARLESSRTDVTEARPGDEIVIETVLRPYRGERIVRQIPVRIPTSAPKGMLRILVSDGDTLDRMRRMNPNSTRRMDLGSTIALINKEHQNQYLYVSILQANPQAMVEDKVMPTLPLSVMNVMDGMRGTRDMIIVGESSVNESSTPLDYVVTGAQILTVTIK